MGTGTSCAPKGRGDKKYKANVKVWAYPEMPMPVKKTKKR